MKIYLAMKNADMTEGRGPMLIDAAFLHRKHAAAYIDGQQGVMGRCAKWSQQDYGDWMIQELEVYDTEADAKQMRVDAIRKRALKKLTKEEIEALNLDVG